MSSGNNVLGYSIRAQNDAEAALREVAGQMGIVEGAVSDTNKVSADLNTTWGRLQAGVDELGNSLDELGEKIKPGGGVQELADGFGNLERVLNGTKDVLEVVGDQFGVNLGPMVEYTAAAGQVAGGMEGILAGGAQLAGQLKTLPATIGPTVAATWAHVTALWAQATAFIAANAPMLVLIATIALVAAGIFLLIKHWDDLKEKYPPLQEAQDKVTAGLQYLRDILMDHVVPALQTAYAWFHEHIEPTLLTVARFVGDLVVKWVELHVMVAEVAVPLIIGALGMLEVPINLVIGWVKGIIDVVQTAIGWLNKLTNTPNATPGNGNVGGGGSSWGSSTNELNKLGGGIAPLGAYGTKLVWNEQFKAWEMPGSNAAADIDAAYLSGAYGNAAAMGKGGTTYNLHFHGFVGDIDALIDEIDRRRVA